MYLKDRDYPCQGCNYNLKDSENGFCPECGTYCRFEDICNSIVGGTGWGRISAERRFWRASVIGNVMPILGVGCVYSAFDLLWSDFSMSTKPGLMSSIPAAYVALFLFMFHTAAVVSLITFRGTFLRLSEGVQSVVVVASWYWVPLLCFAPLL